MFKTQPNMLNVDSTRMIKEQLEKSAVNATKNNFNQGIQNSSSQKIFNPLIVMNPNQNYRAGSRNGKTPSKMPGQGRAQTLLANPIVFNGNTLFSQNSILNTLQQNNLNEKFKIPIKIMDHIRYEKAY